MLTADDTPPFHLLNKGLRGDFRIPCFVTLVSAVRASKLETEGHLEVAFRSDRVAEVTHTPALPHDTCNQPPDVG